MAPTTYNQISLPSFMYGTAWKKEATASLVKLAIESGFKAIDTANQLIHYDEARVGEALQEVWKKGASRQDFFLQTKFTPVNGQDHRTPYDRAADLTTQVRQSFDSSLSHLHTDYLDSYVLHGPYSRSGLKPSDWEVWQAMEELYRSGKARMIGVSNVSEDQLSLLCEKASVRPMVVQNRCFASHGWDRDVRDVCERFAIIYQGFSLLTANPGVLSHPYVRSLATKNGATPAQIVFRFSMQVGMLPLTGTSSARHMKEDLDCERFDLSDDEVDKIDNIAFWKG
ncbi:MAG TPA: aldo/keto reductase [Candidatus Obscuribacterales bacterium]